MPKTTLITRAVRLLSAGAVTVAAGATALVVATAPAQADGAWSTIARCESTANFVAAGPERTAGVDYRGFGASGTTAPPPPPSGLGCAAAP